jgi:hypothetical protein
MTGRLMVWVQVVGGWVGLGTGGVTVHGVVPDRSLAERLMHLHAGKCVMGMLGQAEELGLAAQCGKRWGSVGRQETDLIAALADGQSA